MHALIEWMKDHAIDLCLAGEESYLVKDEGLANLCGEAGIPCWGPPKEAAQLEATQLDPPPSTQRYEAEVLEKVPREDCPVDDEAVVRRVALPIAIGERLQRRRSLVAGLPDRGEQE